MALNHNLRMSARLLSFVIWAGVAASALFWAYRFTARPAPVPAHAEVVGIGQRAAAPLARLFGQAPVQPAAAPAAAPMVADPRLRLIGVVAPGPGRRSGVALITIDDRPARAVPVGGRVDGTLVVLSVSHRQVDLGPSGGPATMSLSLPILPEPARGVPPSAMPGQAPPPPMPLNPARPAPVMPQMPVMPMLPQQLTPIDAPAETTTPGLPQR